MLHFPIPYEIYRLDKQFTVGNIHMKIVALRMKTYFLLNYNHEKKRMFF